MQLNKHLSISVILLFLVLGAPYSRAQSPSTVTEYEKTYTTYPFSDPDPVAKAQSKWGGIYPYFRFQGFTDKAIEKEWKIVELENDFIKVRITPEIGGKIWTAIDKKADKPFVYDNDVVKFRDIAIRGAWTSGGIEFNYGVLGHTPGVATPVNYVMRENEDGSASCIISLKDRLTETQWSLEIRLPRDKAYFITRSFWHNGSGIDQPYYTWVNMGQKVSGGLQYLYPGDHFIGHPGDAHPWPVDNDLGKDRSFYDNNDFAGVQASTHILGTYSKYFGAFWHDEDFGMIHYGLREDKIGKKIFIWELSRRGGIWEDILTDHSGQYMEMQSGRLFNQNTPGSVFTPFKQTYFIPYGTDTWEEYWYPFSKTEGALYADLNGVFNVKEEGDSTYVYFSSVDYIEEELKVLNQDDAVIYRKALNLEPLQTVKEGFVLPEDQKIKKIVLGKSKVLMDGEEKKSLNRPLESPEDFDWESAYGLYLRGVYEGGTREYGKAEDFIRSSLKKSPNFVPSLAEMSFLQYRKMNNDSAKIYAQKALSIDTYDPKANYYYGLSSLALGDKYDAKDGFDVATISTEYRSASYTELAKMAFIESDYEKSSEYAKKALKSNDENLTALQIQYVAERKLSDTKAMESIKKEILGLEPLNPFIHFESFWQDETEKNKDEFASLIREEQPAQTYLNLAIWYYNLGLNEESAKVLDICPDKDNEILYWLAFLSKEEETGENWLKEADKGDPYFVFPYRRESASVMEWAVEHSEDWKPRYFLALIKNFRGHADEALTFLESVGQETAFAPLYATRAQLKRNLRKEGVLADYEMAASIDKKEWRYGKYLTDYLMNTGEAAKALEVIKPYYEKNPDNYIIGMLYTRCLIANNAYDQAEKILDVIHILPYEGASEGHALFEKVKLVLALQELEKKKYSKALKKITESKEWPERLGVGIPYEDEIDTTLQDNIKELVLKTQKSRKLDKDTFDLYMNRLKGTSQEDQRMFTN